MKTAVRHSNYWLYKLFSLLNKAIDFYNIEALQNKILMIHVIKHFPENFRTLRNVFGNIRKVFANHLLL